jgi:predicted RecA/RadA family phage recombinase
MANNYKYSGKRVTLSPATPVASGTLARVKGFIGIPLNNRVAGESVAFALEGVWGMTVAVQGTVPSIGTMLYWDTTGSCLSLGAANDDYPAVKCVTTPNASTGAFDGLLLPQARPYGQMQS